MLVDGFAPGMTDRRIKQRVELNGHFHAPCLLEVRLHEDVGAKTFVGLDVGLFRIRHWHPSPALAASAPDSFGTHEDGSFHLTGFDPCCECIQVTLGCVTPVC